MLESREIPPSLTRHPHGHQKILKGLMQQGLTEVEARNTVAQRLSDPITRAMMRGERSKRRLAEQISLIDPLTGLPNRRALLGDGKADPPLVGRLKEIYEHAMRHGEVMTVVMLDLDNFKRYNDNHGHQAGDEALRVLGQLIRRSVRTADFPARYGGEELTIVLPDTDREHALILIERLREEVERIPYKRMGGIQAGTAFLKEKITISAGLAGLGSDMPGVSAPDVLLQQADYALYQAKKEGRNRVSCYTGSST